MRLYFTDMVDNDRNVIERGDRQVLQRGRRPFAGEFGSFYGSYSTYFKPSRRITKDGEIFDPETLPV